MHANHLMQVKGKQMKPVEIFNVLEAFEGHIADLYSYFAELFHADSMSFLFFERMSREEKQHQNMVRGQRDLYEDHGAECGDLSLDFYELNSLSDEISHILDKKEAVTLEGALRFAYEIESSAAEQHHRKIIQQIIPDLSSLLQSLSKYDLTHRGTLVDFARSKGVDLTQPKTSCV